jgi:tRNA (uracil-5-)-methyltransferase TRM9
VLETWRRLRARLPASDAPSILDLGCGNGRFGAWLGENFEPPYGYTGVDSSDRLIEMVRSNLVPREGVRCELVVADLVADDLDEHLDDRTFDLLTLFGLLHHVPALDRRRALLQDLQERLAPGGLMAMTFWQFADHERFRRRFLEWEEYNREASEPVDPTDLEEGDYLLRWGETVGYRYCHFTDPSEAARLVESLDLEILETFRADGEGGDLNLYYLLRQSH